MLLNLDDNDDDEEEAPSAGTPALAPLALPPSNSPRTRNSILSSDNTRETTRELAREGWAGWATG